MAMPRHRTTRLAAARLAPLLINLHITRRPIWLTRHGESVFNVLGILEIGLEAGWNTLRPRGVAVSVVCPDAVQTPMLDLQVDYREAAITFSGARVLTVAAVAVRVDGLVSVRVRRVGGRLRGADQLPERAEGRVRIVAV